MQRRATDDKFNASTMIGLYDPSSEDHQNRLTTRRGLQIYQQRYPNEQLKTQKFDTNLADGANEKNREWDGATQDGITTIRSGPDYNRVNVTLIVPDGSDLAIKERLRSKSHQHPTNLYLSLFVGCFETKDEAAEASKLVNMMLTQFATFETNKWFLDGIEEHRSHLMGKYAHGKRTQNELNFGLRPCGTCHQKFSEKKCGGCKFQWYCCVEHQKEDWAHHKPICKEARVKRKEASKNIKTAKKTEKRNQKNKRIVSSSLEPLILSPPATKQEKQDVSELYAFLFDLDGNRLLVFQKINYLDIMQKHPRDWTIMVQEHPDWFSKMSELIIGADCDKSDFKKNEPVFGLWFMQTFLVIEGNTAIKCNALRIFQYMVDTENGFESILVSLYGSLLQLYHPKTSKSNCQHFFESAREILRILDTSILLNEVVASQIVTTHVGKPSVVLLFQEMHEMVQKSKEKLSMKSKNLNKFIVIENHLLSTIGLIHVWTVKLQVHVTFFDEMKFNQPRDELYYRTYTYRLSEIQIKEGRTFGVKDHQWLEETEKEAELKARKDIASDNKRKKKDKKKKQKIIPFLQRYQKITWSDVDETNSDQPKLKDRDFKQLMSFCHQGKFNKVKQLLKEYLRLKKRDVDVNQADKEGWTPLLLVCQFGHLKIFKLLLKNKGIDIHKTDKNERSPLFLACQHTHLKMAELLIEAGADVNALSIDRKNGTKDGTKVAILYMVCQNGHLALVKLLLRKDGILINHVSNGSTALIEAAAKGHPDVVRELLKMKGLQINYGTTAGGRFVGNEAENVTALFSACQNNHLNIVKQLLNMPEIQLNKAMFDGATPLSMASQEGHVKVVKALLKMKGIKINRANRCGGSPLFLACFFGHLEVVKLFLKRKEIQWNQATLDGRTPLSTAQERDHTQIVTLLLQFMSTKN